MSRARFGVLTWVLLTALAACSGVSGGGGSSDGTGSGGNTFGSGAVIRSIEITPSNPHVATGTGTQLSATAILSDSSHQDVTSRVTWTSSNTQAATVSKG